MAGKPFQAVFLCLFLFRFRLFAVMTGDIFFDNGLEFFRDVVTFQGDCFLSIFIDGGHWCFARSGQADADIGVFALTRPVDDTSHDCDVHFFHASVTFPPQRHFFPEKILNLLCQPLKIIACGAATTRT